MVPNSVIDNGDGTYRENMIPVDPTALHTFYSDRGGLIGQQSAVISRSYLKLRDAGIAYRIPVGFCSKLHLACFSRRLERVLKA